MTTKTDNVKQSEKDGTVTTDEGKKVEATSPAIPDGAEDKPLNDDKNEKAEILSRDDMKSLFGDLEPGEEGYLPLNRDGTIAGPAKEGKPPVNQPFAPVIRQSGYHDELTTPSGAPIARVMNPTVIKPEDEPAKHDGGTKAVGDSDSKK